MIIREATPEDVTGIAAIQSASPEASQWKPESYLDHECWVAIEEDRVAGFLAIRQIAPGEREILNLAVDPARRRRGIAKALLEHTVKHIEGAWFLEVRASNTAASALYESAGFRAVGRRPDYYQQPAEEAIVMAYHS